MDQDERQRKLEAGRAKLAHFRRSRAKSDSSSTQKKTAKRKGQTNACSAQERHLEEPQTDDCHGEISKEYSEASLRPEGTESSVPDVHQCSREADETNAQEQSSSSGYLAESEPPDQAEGELAEMIIVAHTGKEQLKQLQAAVEKRNEIISQLSKNLQGALQSRDQVQLEAQELSGQIQALQQQLQQAKEYLRIKSQGCVDPTQAAPNQLHEQLEESQQVTKEQQCLLAKKEAEITGLQQKLCVMEKSLSQLQHAFTQRSADQSDLRLDQHGGLDLSNVSLPLSENSPDSNSEALTQSLRAELEEERKNSQRAQEQIEAFQKRVQSLEDEKTQMEAHLAAFVETQAQEAQHYKAEKDELNQEMARLDNLVKELQNRLHEEEKTGHHMRSKYEADISNYDLRLQTLEEERELNVAQLTEAHGAAFRRLQEEHSDEIHRIKELLNQAQSQQSDSDQNVSKDNGADVPWNIVSKEHYSEETVIECAVRDSFSFDVSTGGFQDVLMERYLASEGPQESSLLEGSLEERSLIENSETSRFELDSEVIFHASDYPNVTSDGDKSEPGLPGVSAIDAHQPDEMSFNDAQWQTSAIEELNESAGTLDLAKQLLIQQCQDLSEQLEDRERQLEVLQEEVQRSAEEVEEARERWSKASEELEEAKWELEMEREKRIQYEEVISQKMNEDNLKNILSDLQVQGNERIMPHNTDSNKTSIPLSTEELLKELREEKAQLVLQLKLQEQIAKDVHDQKAAGDSVISEFSSLQAQRDEFQLQLEQQREKHQATSVLLGQRTLQLDQADRELQQLKAEVEEKAGRLQDLEEEKTDLESKLVCLKENLTNMEEEKATLERRLEVFEDQAKSMEKVLESELKNFEHQLESKDAELKEVREAQEKAEEEYMEKESALMKELISVKQNLEERQEQHEKEQKILEEKHQKEIKYLNVRFERELSEQSAHLEDEQKRQTSLIKQVYEREHERELTQLAAQQSEEIARLKDELVSDLQEGLEAAHQAELLQTQSKHNLELEALRLSLTNLHTAQLELSQTNMQKDKEVALSELQTMLREKWAQESAMLQTRQQFELERVREQNREQEQRNQGLYQQEIDNLNQEWERRVLEEKSSVEQLQGCKLEDLKAKLLSEAEEAKTELQSRLNDAHHKLSETQKALSEAEAALSETQCRLEERQRSTDQVIKNLEKELNQALTDRDAAARAVEELIACHKAALQEKQEHARALEQREKELTQEVDRLQSEREELKASSEQEISNLWSQLESMRTNRQELGELKEQLLARSSRVDDIERLKQEFAQQRQEIKELNETELENLRTYFEQRLRVTEESHREEIALLQLRLIEGALEDSVLQTGDASFLSEGKSEDDRSEAMAEITRQLEKQKEELDSLRMQLEERHQQELDQLRSRMTLVYKEDLLQARTELTDRYYKDIDQLNTKHAHELEQLRAKLSDNHIKEINKLRLQSAQDLARQVEAEVKERTRQHQAKVTQLETQLSQLSLMHSGELEKVAEQHREQLRQMETVRDVAEDLRVRLEEAQKAERNRASEELTEEQARLREQLQLQAEERLASQREQLQRSALEEKEEFEQRLLEVQKLLDVERQSLQALQKSLECEESPQVVALKQKLQAQYDREMCTARSTMAAEVKELNALLQDQMESKLQDALCRHQEEQKQLEEKLTLQRDAALGQQREQHAMELQAQKTLLDQRAAQLQDLEKECQDLKIHHREELESLTTNRKTALETLEMELTNKHKAELDKLEAVLQETNLAQLEAQEAELQARHKQEREELEERLMANMDTLESTYLNEIQAVRDEKDRELRDLQEHYTREIERVRKKEQTIREDHRREVANVHMDKFSAMARELHQAHQAEMSEAVSSQRAALDDEHLSSLEALQQQVVALEKQHSAALLEITDIATAEKKQHEQQLDELATQHQQQLDELATQHQQQLNELTTQHQQQLQELRVVSARELVTLRRELEEEASRQRLHFLEEAELLKCKSGEQLQQRIAQLKEESDQEKAVSLEELERALRQQHEQTELTYSDKMSQLTAQLQQLDTVVSQLQSEVSGLQVELEGKRAEMDTLETLLQRRDRENQEGDNLLAMLRADLNTATQDRQDLQTARDKLQRMLIEMVRITMATDEHISRKLGACVSGGQSGDKTPSSMTARSSRDSHETGEVIGTEGEADCSVWSSAVDEGLELSQRLCESVFSGPEGEMEAEGEELMLGSCTRLRTAVDKLLELLSESSQQLEQMCGLQAVLNEQFRDGGEAGASLLFQNSQLLEQLDHEASLKSQLQLELHKTEGLMEGYIAEKAILEEALQQKETQEQRLAEELESTRIQLQQLNENHALLLRQREALTASLGDTEKGFLDAEEDTALLAEAERLGQECVEVQRQAEKDCGGLASRLQMLEQALEEQESRGHQLEEQHRLQTEDLQQHIDALEKQLKQNRQFIDEQAVEREHERDEFQQEIKNLEAQLRHPSKGHAGGNSKGQRIEDLVLQVENLQALIKDKIEDYGILLSAKEQCQLDVEERNEEIEKLATRIRELEQALLSCAEASRTVTQLEQELQKARKNLQELTQDKEALQQQQYANKLQISALQSKLDETRHRFPDMTPDPNLLEQLEATQQDLQTKEQQVELLSERTSELEKDVVVREEELGQLTLQLELKNRESRATEEQLHAHITHLQDTVDTLTRRLEEGSDESILQLPSALLEEKNMEIDHLNQQILQLQQELDLTNDNKTLEEKQAEIEELRSQVERLRCDQERLRQAKEEETERLHEVINKLQEELSQLDPNHHEVSDPSTDSAESSDFPWSSHPRQQRASEESLCQELSSHTLQSSRARLQELKIELERADGEKDSLQRLLLSQEEEYGSQVEALGRSLGEERGKVVLLEQEANELTVQLEEKRTEAERLAARVEELEDAERAHQSSMRESEFQLRRVEERKDEVQQELDRLQEEAKNQRVEKELLENQISELQHKEEHYENELAALQSTLTELEEHVQIGRANVSALETGKRELYMEREALRKREGYLQEEIEHLKQEMTSKMNYIKELHEQQEETVAKQGEAQKEVLTCAEETLAKAETALREREQQLIHLRAEHDALRAELTAVKEGLSTSTERAEKLLEEGQTKDRALADLEVLNQHLKAELRSLQDDLAVQEEELAYQQRELEQLRQRCNLQDHRPKHVHCFLEGLSRDPSLSASLSSPEVLRRLDCSEERPSRLQVSHFSELSALHNASLELHSKASPMEQDKERPHGRQMFIPPSEEVQPITHSASPCSLSLSEHLSVLDSLDAVKVIESDNSDVTLSRSPLGSTSPESVPEWVSDGYGSNVSSELEAMLKLELENTERLDAHFVEYLRCRGMSPAQNTDSAAGSMNESHEALTPELQAMLKRVYQESCRILSLSHRPAPSGQSRPDSEPAPPPSWQRERRALQETILSLRELLCRMADREPKTDSGDVDWRRELLHAVRSVFDSEREWLHSQLQAFMTSSTQMDLTPLLDQLKKLFQKQEEQQWRSLEQLFNADRHSLLAEVRSLHASSQQSQEQLRQLQDSLHTAKEHGTETQHQLHRDVEELELRLQKEQTRSNDLCSTLEAEKSRGLEQQRQLEAELKAVSVLKAELEETRLQLQSAYKIQEELKSQIHKLRLKLEHDEAEHQACLQAVEKEQARVQELQEDLQQQRLNDQQTIEQNHQNQESLHQALNEQESHVKQLNSALNQESITCSNLRSELQIEQSRCEALMAQERERTELALSRLEEERSRSAELSDSLSRQAQEHARRLEEEARRQEAASAHDRKFIQDLRTQLEHERRQGEDLAAMLERLQGQVLEGKRRQAEEAERKAHKEQEEVRRLRAALEGLQTQKTEVGRTLEAERERAAHLQVELDVMKEKMRVVKEREEEMERKRRQEKQEQLEKERRQERTNEKLMELELLRQKDQQRLRQLQQTLADLEQEEKRLTSERLQRDTHSNRLTFAQNTLANISQDSTSSTPSLMERLLKENSEFSECLAALSEEKIALKHTISCMERDLQSFRHQEQVKPPTVTEQCVSSEKLAWQKEKAALQTALRKAEAELSRVTASNENRPINDLSNNKVQRLYERYLRAESYRKSLVYQKRYLLLLLGGFQECEQATLALIARMGAQPTLSQSQVSRPLNRFRTSVRVVIAISRLKFLTRKWQRATRKISGSATVNGHGTGPSTVPALRTEVLRPQQTGVAFNSPPTRDHAFAQRGVVSSLVPPIKSPFRLNNRMYTSSVPGPAEHSFSSSQDQERSLTEYIQHLETVQQRLGAAHPGSPPMIPYARKSDR
ncbi:pericentrin isoform X2 [Rhinichthys klamathensis goyatoka]|uniref:pericentrin isoform X2 n=1 Tax=Rhinichthys klamathensis goyatoka TaxID=3034132 RepID=UPI0024B4D2BF|nr:pericentrin isoform X2 [Rhinichthys klamathensis goyatoka]